MTTGGKDVAGATPEAGKALPRRLYITPRPIAVFLILVVAVTILPALGFSVVLLQRNNEAQQQVVETLADATASSMSETIDREVSGMLTILRVLATTPTLERHDFKAFYDRSQRALAGTGAFLIVLDSHFNQLLNTRKAYGAPLGPPADKTSAAEALEKRQPVISNTFFGNTAQKWVFNVASPYFPDTGEPLVLLLTQNTAGLTRALVRHGLTDGWNVTLVDRRNIVIASSSMHDEVGRPFFLDLISQGPSPSGRVLVNYQGTSYRASVQVSELTGWKTIIWAPASVMQRPMRRSLKWLIIGGLVVILFGTGAALFLAREITRSIRWLARDARKLGAGASLEPVVYPIAEINTVSAALAEAAAHRVDAENEIRFLMREVAHRSKNQLTVVSSIAKQTARNARSIGAFQDSFQKRLFGLARSTDLLIAGGVAGVEFSELLETQVEPFKPNDEDRLELSGPKIRLANQAAQMLGLGLHELSTNAAKYGAFSVPSGRLVVHWRVEGEAFHLVWREFVARLRKRPERRGFGTEVIERMLAGALSAKAERLVHRDGLEWRFEIPLERILSASQLEDEG